MKTLAFRTAFAPLVALLAASLLMPAAAPGAAAEYEPLPTFAEPAVSPDGVEVAFVCAGDIWTVPAEGGEARLLVAHDAAESRPVYSPDGRRLAFVSTRTGGGDVYVLTFATGELARLTYDDASEALDGWSRDGAWVYFTTGTRDLGPNTDVYRVASAGGTPMPVAAEQYLTECYAAAHPDGRSLAYAVGGVANREWWRKGHTHWAETRICLRRERDDGAPPATHEPLTPAGAKEAWPLWSPDGKTLYYVSDRDGVQNVWAIDVNSASRPGFLPVSIGASPTTAASKPAAEPRQVTRFRTDRVLYPSITADGRTIVFERDFAIWSLDVGSGRSEPLRVTLRGAPAGQAVEHPNFVGGFRELALSPDGRKVALVVRGEVFAASSKDGGRAVRVTRTPGAESQVVWAPDSRRLAYVADRAGHQHVYLYDFAGNTEVPLTTGEADDSSPRFSPDGKRLAFRRGGREVRVLDLATRAQRVVARGLSTGAPPFDDEVSPMVWSPKGQWIAFIDDGSSGFDNVYVVPSDGSATAPRQVTFFANGGSNSVSWGADGQFILFGTGQRTEDYQLARIDLLPRPQSFSEDQFRGLFQEEMRTTRPGPPREPVRPVPERPGPAAPPPPPPPTTLPAEEPPAPATTRPATRPFVIPGLRSATRDVERIVFDGIRRRVSLLPVGIDVDFQTVSPDGKTALIVGQSAGRQNLYVMSTDGDGVLRQVTGTTGPKAFPRFSPDSKEVYYLDGGQIKVVALDGRPLRDLNVSAAMEVDFAAERMEVARQVWKYLGGNFYDPDLHGVDWQDVRRRYFPHVAGSRTPEEMRRVLLMMVGELGASHLGVRSGDRGGSGAPVGKLGVRFDRATYERDGKLKVAHVLPQGPAEQAGIRSGDFVLAVDGEPLDERSNLDALLERKTGRRVVLRRATTPDGVDESEVAVRPVDTGTERTLLYRAWVEANRTYVDKASKGRLGYVHIADMSQEALARLMLDLDAEVYGKRGVVVDVRGNTGGFVSPYALDVFARKGFLAINRRGGPTAPGRTYVGQRAMDLSTVLLTNRGSISDAENFTEGYRALGLGKVVGEPTAGGVIFTSDVQLLDGTSLRLPHSRVDARRDGASLERNPRPVDVTVVRPVGESLAGKDGQLDAAVEVLTKQVDAAASVQSAERR